MEKYIKPSILTLIPIIIVIGALSYFGWLVDWNSGFLESIYSLKSENVVFIGLVYAALAVILAQFRIYHLFWFALAETFFFFIVSMITFQMNIKEGSAYAPFILIWSTVALSKALVNVFEGPNKDRLGKRKI
ncbi:hypothetical protein DSL64_10000 [Dyadobacter luteus]|uniref:Uncharacterized protein n=1 Tax=Dyadobacter luteus TaxID=2259619 RepID=A0A3D8YC82_9BACT|nr:hypothetical protein [Dyadobacter luteus]REA61992.1 hypothetical protein DSL64_10000 [Dyadobacter luteus]